MKNPCRYAFLLGTLFLACFWQVDARGAKGKHTMSDYLVYIGTYTGPGSEGIYVYKLAAATGKLEPLGLAAKSTSPSFLAIAPNHQYLYAVNEINFYDGQRSGSVSAFSIDHKTGKLSLLNVLPSGGAGSTHLSVDNTGKDVLVANYNAGSVAVLPILPDGRLGSVTAVQQHSGHGGDLRRQRGPHAHSIYVSPDNRFAVSADLGTDQVYVYRFDAAQGMLAPNDPPTVAAPPGSGPRHMAFAPNGKFVYAIEELGSSLTTFSYDAARGVLDPLGTISTLPSDFKGKSSCAEVMAHPNGKFLYGSNRGHDSIAVFALDPVKGTPTPIQYASTEGEEPRGFGLDPTGSFLVAANQNSNNLAVFRIDKKTGRLTPTGQKLDIQKPVCVVFEPMK